ncbi:hypothetical protein C0995_010567 [Termitomyces sp. Mi166|nr:hypothetical protein C0995_010567 [Termitomyces sp. Mi166\
MSKSGNAVLEIPSGIKLSTLKAGMLQPKMLFEFARVCCGYFRAEKIPVLKQVETICACFHDPYIADYVNSNLAKLSKLSFINFITDIGKHYLWDGWQCYQLKAGIDNNLDHCADKEGIYKEADLKKFVDALDVCNQKRQGNMPMAKKSGGSAANSRVADKTNGGAKRTLRLTDLEREYLKMMKGCYNCQNPEAGHFLSNCPEEGPLPGMPKVLQGWKPLKPTSANSSGLTLSRDTTKAKPVVADSVLGHLDAC